MTSGSNPADDLVTRRGTDRRSACLGLGSLFLVGCAGDKAPPQEVRKESAAEREDKIAKVARALLALGPNVAPAEADRAARVAVDAPLQWAEDWQVVDAPLIHNFKVIHGMREKGVCQDWADAMHAAMAAQDFRTLALHRAMANADNVKLEHATLIVAAREHSWDSGLILDPWRLGQGRLWFGHLSDDDRYGWESLATVHARRQKNRARHRASL